LEAILSDIRLSVDHAHLPLSNLSKSQQDQFIDQVACANVLRTVQTIQRQSRMLHRLVKEGRIAIVGAMYDVVTGNLTFLTDEGQPSTECVAESDNVMVLEG
jgi:carbonic anhydrase